jgi:hypothetical protein
VLGVYVHAANLHDRDGAKAPRPLSTSYSYFQNSLLGRGLLSRAAVANVLGLRERL